MKKTQSIRAKQAEARGIGEMRIVLIFQPELAHSVSAVAEGLGVSNSAAVRYLMMKGLEHSRVMQAVVDANDILKAAFSDPVKFTGGFAKRSPRPRPDVAAAASGSERGGG